MYVAVTVQCSFENSVPFQWGRGNVSNKGGKKDAEKEGSVFYELKDSRFLPIANLKSGRLVSVLSGICLISAKCIDVFLRVQKHSSSYSVAQLLTRVLCKWITTGGSNNFKACLYTTLPCACMLMQEEWNLKCYGCNLDQDDQAPGHFSFTLFNFFVCFLSWRRGLVLSLLFM